MTTGAARPTLKTGGALDPLHDLYVERQSDAELLNLILQGEYCNILSSRQVGKSSLINRTAMAIMQRGHRVAIIDVAGNLGTPDDADQWYRAFLGEIVRQLRVEMDVAAWWAASAETTANQRLLQFFRDLVSRVDAPVSVFVDEIDHTLKFSYTDDFFTAIRSMYNARPLEPVFRQVTFCLVGVATPHELIKNRRTTAYNVGRTIELADFDPAVDDLSQLYAAVSDDPETGSSIVRAILHWTGGHPYLTARLCRTFAGGAARDPQEIDALVERQYENLNALRTDVHFQQITRFLEERVKDGPAAFALYERILRRTRTPEESTPVHALLKLSGLVKRDRSGDLIIRNRLYARVFSEKWVRATKPLRARRRLRVLAVAASVAAIALAGAVAYNSLVILPARTAYFALSGTTDEAVAANAFQILTGDGAGLIRRWLPTGYRRQARDEYKAFWDRRAARFDERARERLRLGELDQAFILAAAAAVKRNGALAPEVMRAYDARALTFLKTTLHPLRAPGDKSALRYDFTADGRSVLLNWGGPFGPNLLVITDASTGAPYWEYATKNAGFFLAGGDYYGEQINDEAKVFDRINKRSIGPFSRGSLPSWNLDDTMGYFAAISQHQVRVWDLESGNQLFDVTATPAISSVHMSYTKEMLAVQGPGRLLIWKQGTSSPVASIRTPGPGAGQSFITFSSDDRYVSRLEAIGTRMGTRLDVWSVGGSHVLSGSSLPGVVEEAFFVPGAPLLVAQWVEPRSRRRGAAVFNPTSRPSHTIEGRLQGITDDGSAVATLVNNRLQIWVSGKDGFRPGASIPVEDSWAPTEVKFAPSGHLILFRDNKGLVRVWDWGGMKDDTGAEKLTNPLERWQRWQVKFGLTLSSSDDVVPLTFAVGTATPQLMTLRGWSGNDRD